VGAEKRAGSKMLEAAAMRKADLLEAMSSVF
jgi:hypothetical protein